MDVKRKMLYLLILKVEKWRHAYNIKRNMLPEHPRTSTTDNIEWFYETMWERTLEVHCMAHWSFLQSLYSRLEESYTALQGSKPA